LRNAIERAMILEDTAYIRPASLPIAVWWTDSSTATAAGMQALSPGGDAMKTAGNQTQAARLCGSRVTRCGTR
jgi:hypothetical protein